MKMKKGFVHIILVLVVLAIAIVGGFFFFSNRNALKAPTEEVSTPREVTGNKVDSKTYVGKGLSFNYPSTWSIKELDDLVAINPPDVKKNDPTGSISIFITPINEDVSTDLDAKKAFDNFMNSCSSETPVSCDEKTSDQFQLEKQITVDGKIAFQTYGGCCQEFGRNVFVFKGNYRYKITLYNLGSKENLINEDVYGQILSTFQFTDQNTSTSKLYQSDKLGVQFNYKPSYFDTTISTKEVGNKIYVYASNTKAEDGQYLEEFSKEPQDSLELAIKKKFLAGYSESDCFVEKLKNDNGFGNLYPDSYELATISYPLPTDTNLPFFANAEKCPAIYSKTNGINYFVYDKNHADKYLFVSVGQYAIDSGIEGKVWQHTIRFIK